MSTRRATDAAQHPAAESVDRFVAFDCEGARCIGVLSEPASGIRAGDVAVLVVVGGPQYRVGSHRQFVLLARELAAAGFPVLRFDYRGMGDSDGESRTFEAVDADLRCAIAALVAETSLPRVVLWGLCDAASAALMYAADDARVAGVIAANPWVHTDTGEAVTRLRHYYVRRLFSAAFWRKLLRGGVRVRASASQLVQSVRTATSSRAPTAAADYLQRMQRGWQHLKRPVLVLLSGNDYTAREFEAWIEGSAERSTLLRGASCEVTMLPDADHTFSRRAWRDAVADRTIAWLRTRCVQPDRDLRE